MSRIRLGTAALVVTLVAGVARPAGASPIDDKQRQAQQIADRIEQLGDEAASLGEAYNGAQLALQDSTAAVTDAERRLSELDAKLATMRTAMSQFALKAYMYADQTTGLAATVAGTSLDGGSAQRAGYTQVALGASTTATDDLKAVMEDARRERRQLADREAAKEKAVEEVAARRKAAETAKTKQEQLLPKVKGELATLVAQEQQHRREQAAQLTQAQLPKVDAALAAAALNRPQAAIGVNTMPGAPPAVASPAPAVAPASSGQAAAPAALTKSPATTAKPATKPAPRPVDTPSTSPGAAIAVKAALAQLGVPYVFNAAEPGVAFDCSGLTMWAWAQAGVSMAHYTVTQWNSFPHVPMDQIQPGDLIFSYGLGHVGIYIGNGMMVAAPRTGDVVKITPVFTSYRPLDGAVRPG